MFLILIDYIQVYGSITSREIEPKHRYEVRNAPAGVIRDCLA